MSDQENDDLSDLPTVTFDAPSSLGEKLGSMVGPYKLLGVLGEGGFGTVYVAEQETPIRRRVALKIIKAGMDTRQVLARFEAERQALAVMDHPNIAKVFDAGSTPSGRSYFVMELVHGEPITEYCDRHKLTLEERLELFAHVCQAMQHAHQKGIIHRDLKPKNVLVAVMDDQPMPKIIDFGVAKATAQPLTQHTIFTEQGQLIGTPEYMSPEQAEMSNLDIDTRSDIYSLGVLLYELLTGALPFDRHTLRQAGFDEIRRLIREVEPPKPSTKISTLGEGSQELAASRRTDLPGLQRRLRRELDWIVMKTLEKDRTRRYATAVALAEDVQRYLAHEPVHAGPPGGWYRIRKYARRYRVPLGIAAGFVALLLVITILAIGGYYREARLRADTETARGQAEAARRDAQEEAERAKQNFAMACDAVKKYYTRVAGDPRLKPHNLELLRRDLLESANEFYEKLISQDADNSDLRHECVWAFFARADIEMALGNWRKAEAAFGNAMEAATRLNKSDGNDANSRYNLAVIHDGLGGLYANTGHAEEAISAHKKALAIWNTLTVERPEMHAWRNRLAGAHNGLGMLNKDAGRTKEAEEEYKQALAIWEGLAEEHPEEPEYQSSVADSHNNLGNICQDTGRANEAMAAFEKVLAIRTVLAKQHPDVPEYQNRLAICYMNMGNIHYVSMHRAEESKVDFRSALAIWKTMAQQHPDMPEYQYRLAGLYNNLGNLCWMTDQDTEAQAAFREALNTWRSLAEKHPEIPEYQYRLATLQANFIALYAKSPVRANEGEAASKEAFSILNALVQKYPNAPEYQNGLAAGHHNLGLLYRATARVKEAAAEFKQAEAIWADLATKHPEASEYRDRLAKVRAVLDKLNKPAAAMGQK
jgi:eukaryotic-like serine/threonine-protein kinase